MIIINLQKNITTKHIIPKKKEFKSWILPIFKKIKGNYSITIRIVNKNEIKKLNLTYRKKNKSTNILTFAYEHFFNKNIKFIGDIVICIDEIYEESKKYNKFIISHFAHITIHGILHMLGYNHSEKSESKKMEKLEIMYMRKLGYSNPYIA